MHQNRDPILTDEELTPKARPRKSSVAAVYLDNLAASKAKNESEKPTQSQKQRLIREDSDSATGESFGLLEGSENPRDPSEIRRQDEAAKKKLKLKITNCLREYKVGDAFSLALSCKDSELLVPLFKEYPEHRIEPVLKQLETSQLRKVICGVYRGWEMELDENENKHLFAWHKKVVAEAENRGTSLCLVSRWYDTMGFTYLLYSL